MRFAIKTMHAVKNNNNNLFAADVSLDKKECVLTVKYYYQNEINETKII